MALNKQPFNINFGQGLDLKTDPYQVPAGKFLALSNTIFDKGGQLQKRNGYGPLPTLPTLTSTTLSTFNNNLLAIGNALNSLSIDNGTWYNKGTIQPVSLLTAPVVRNTNNQISGDVAVAPNGLACAAYTNSDGTTYYQVTDSVTSQVIVPQTSLPSTANSPRVYSLGVYFVITFIVNVAGNFHLQYIAVPIQNPTSPTSASDLITGLNGINAGNNGTVANNNLYVAADMLATPLISITYLDSTLVQHAVITTGHAGTLISITADVTGSNSTIWVTEWAAGTAITKAYDHSLNSLISSVTLFTGVTINEITSSAQNGVLSVFYEVANTYSYSPNAKTDYISKITCTIGSVVGTPTVILRGVGLASKAFYYIPNAQHYMLAVYGGAYQPTYFLIDGNGNMVAKLAYSNGGGYATSQVLPGFTFNGTTAFIGYLIKDLLAPVNKTQGATGNISGIYSQTGINLASFNLATNALDTSEIGGSLSIAGGQMWLYDGVKPTEQGFVVWPEDITAVSPSTNLSAPGAMLEQTYFYQVTYEWTDSNGNIHRSAPSVPLSVDVTSPANHTFASTDVSTSTSTVTFTGHNYPTGLAVTLTTAGTLPSPLATGTTYYIINRTANSVRFATSLANANAGTYIPLVSTGSGNSTINVTAGQGSVLLNIPTLRQTYKTTPNAARIVIYRWAADQQTYYQITSVSNPILNDPTVDSITYLDTQSSAQILGNLILYTTGGVIEDISSPACSAFTLYKSRLVLVDAEDRNSLWYSKQVIENTPVELSDLLTIYVAPTTGAQGSTGPITALSAMDDKLIVFKKDAIYYITGNGPDNTGANNDFSDPVFITSTVGCSNQQSIVFIPEGLLFQSDKGIWLLGRDLSTKYVGAPVQQYNSNVVLSAITVPATNQVRFTLDNNITLMFDYFYEQWATFSGIPAISSTIYEGLHTYLNSSGAVFQETPGQYLDASNPVLMSYTTNWYNLAGLQGYERLYFVYLLGTYYSPFKLNVQLAYDYNSGPSQSLIVTPDNYSTVYGGPSPYGSDSPYGDTSEVFQARLFPSKQKCESFQVSVQEIYDPSYGVAAGAGLTMSGMNLVVGMKKGYRPAAANRSFG